MSALTGNLGGGGGLKIVNGVLNAYPAFNDEKIEKGAFIEFANQQEGAVGIVNKKIQDASSTYAYTEFLTENLCVSVGGESGGTLYVRAATVTNGSARWGTRLLLRDEKYTAKEARVLRVSEDTFLVASGSTQVSINTTIYLCSVSGTTITVQAQKANANSTALMVAMMAKVDEGKYLVIGESNSPSSYVKAFLFTLNGKIITFGDIAENYNYGVKYRNPMYYFPKSATKGCFLYLGDYGDCEGYVLSISGMKLSFSSKISVISSGYTLGFTHFDDGDVLMFYSSQRDYYTYAYKLLADSDLKSEGITVNFPLKDINYAWYESIIQNCNGYFCGVFTTASSTVKRIYFKFRISGSSVVWDEQVSLSGNIGDYAKHKNQWCEKGTLLWVSGTDSTNMVNSLRPDGLQKCVKKSVTKIEGFTQTEVTRAVKGKVWELKKEG